MRRNAFYQLPFKAIGKYKKYNENPVQVELLKQKKLACGV